MVFSSQGPYSALQKFCCSVSKWCPTLQPHGLQHPRLPCPSLFTRVCSNSCPSSHPFSPPSSPGLNLSQHQGLSQWVGSLHQVAKVLELQHQSFQWIFRTDFLWDWLVWSCSPGDFQESSLATQFKSINLVFLMIQLSHPYVTTGKTIALVEFCWQSDVSAS